MSRMVDDLLENVNRGYPKPPDPVRVNGIDQIPLPPEKPWPVLTEDAFTGLAGKIVRHLEPGTEADPNGLLVGLLAAFGNACGPAPHFPIGATLHRANLFLCLVGQSAKARKGTGGDLIAAIFNKADPDWADNHRVSGLSTGEGLAWLGRDAGNDPPEAPHPKLAQTDKRLFVEETEFGLSLQCGSRTGNTLSSALRKLWDFKTLEFVTKTSGFRASGIFTSILAHITLAELDTLLTASDVANGFVNRFLWCCVRRSKKLPFGGDTGGIDDYAKNIGWRLAEAKRIERMVFTPAGAKVWENAYHGELSTDYPGRVGDVVSRAEAQALRLSMIYALLDESPEISDNHVRAALSVWQFSLKSALYVFGDHHGSLADKIRTLLVEAGSAGLTRTQINNSLGRNYPVREIVAALGALRQAGQATLETTQRPGPGRPLETWRTKLN